jgi:hypothetical protein
MLGFIIGRGDRIPALHLAGMAGFVAPAGAWEVFEEQWLDTLDKAPRAPARA